MIRVMILTVVAVLLAGCAGPLQTDPNGGGDGSTISVSSTGSATADPDRAVVRLGVEATADSADDAGSQVASGVESVGGACGRGRPRGERDDGGVRHLARLRPDGDGSGTRRLPGDARAAVETTPARAGEVVDVAVGAGATSVDDVHFTLSDDRRAELRATALDRATTTARTDADDLAAAADLSVTGVERVTTGADFAPGPIARFEDAADGTVLRPAPVSVTVTVDVTYSAR